MENKKTEVDNKPKYRIKFVSRQTGIPSITLRAWERRYQILSPGREGNRYRLYSENDLLLLKWLKARVDQGITISHAAGELHEKLANGNLVLESGQSSTTKKINLEKVDLQAISNQMYELLTNRDESAAQLILDMAFKQMPLIQVFEEIITPFLIRLGNEWYTGKITVSIEHFASSFLLGNLMAVFRRLPIRKNKAKILVGGAPGEMHELGPLMIAILLRESGYFVEFMGPDLPLEDLVLYIQDEKPAMVILAATTDQSAISLQGFSQLLNKVKQPPLFAYGGGAYVLNPGLIDLTPGEYLGSTIRQSLERIEQLV